MLTMQDAVNVNYLVNGYDAYVAYIDGAWPTYTQVMQKFPDSHILTLTTGLGDAIGIDVERGNAGWTNECEAVPGWVKGRIDAGIVRPVVYIEASWTQFIIDKLAINGIARSAFRLFSAHWTAHPHVCAPQVCGYSQADGTQYRGNIENAYDLSLLNDDFFETVVVPPVVTKPPIIVTPSPVSVEEDNMVSAVVVTALGEQAGNVVQGDVFLLTFSPLAKVPFEELSDAETLSNVLTPTTLVGTPKGLTLTCSWLNGVPTVK